MAAPTTIEPGYLVGVRLKGGTASQVHVSFTNARTGETKHVLTQNNDAKVNLNNTKEFPAGFKNADVIDITGTGLRTGNAVHTVNRTKGGSGIIILNMTDVSTTNAPEVRI